MKDNPKMLKRYHIPNADGQVATHCVLFNFSFNKKDYKQDTCSINYDIYKENSMQVCEILNGQFCDCYKKGCGYEV